MHKSPMYIGVFCCDPKQANKQIKQYSKSCLQAVISKNEDQPAVSQDLDMFEQIFTPPKDNHHITTAFLGKNPSPKAKNIHKNFKYQQQIPIKLTFFVYVQGHIMLSYTQTNEIIEVDNKHPHMTLLLSNNAKAVQSNNVLELVFKQKANLMNEQWNIIKLEQKYNDKSVYLVKKQIIVDGITGDNIRNGKR